jgi:hypothetical protein
MKTNPPVGARRFHQFMILQEGYYVQGKKTTVGEKMRTKDREMEEKAKIQWKKKNQRTIGKT